LDLTDPATAPDFVALSFYKIFGFPNIGALIVRKDSAHVLESRKYFGGGTVDMIVAINDTWHVKKDSSIHDRLEDGTLPFHSIFALDHAMNVHERLYGPNPMKFISHHTAQLSRRLYEGLSSLRHANGYPVCRIYKDESAIYGDPSVQGATIAFNVQRADGSLLGFEDVEEAADERNIFVRSGSLCNPGGVATYLGWSPAEMKAAFAAGHKCSNPTQVMLGKPTGVVRVSLGAMSIASDVETLMRFMREVYVSTNPDELVKSQAHHQSSSLGSPAAGPMRQPGQPPMFPRSRGSQVSLKAPSTAASSTADGKEGNMVPPGSSSSDRSKAPPFLPADYVKLRKPWEEEMRRQSPNHPAMEIKVREVEDGSVFSRNPTPSVKARKFGRSVVNLLRTKSHTPDSRYE
jgi:molybdenum cofactor sulfurtransferase